MPKKDALPYSTILVIDTAERNNTSIALISSDNETKIINKSVRAQELPKLINSLLEESKLLPKNIDALALVKRKGSMTAIRIGTTVTNTFAWINKLPIIEVDAQNIDLAVKNILEGDISRVVKTSPPLA